VHALLADGAGLLECARPHGYIGGANLLGRYIN
jgi:hypothetical protein